jgi:outer membrane protein assembly factor BamB
MEVKWEYPSRAKTVASVRGIPTHNNGKVYFSSGSYLSALDSLTGDELWAYNAGDSITHFQTGDAWIVLLKRAFARDVLVVLSAGTGEVIWQQEGLIRSFYLSDNQLFAAFEGSIRAYDAATGEQIWDNQEAATSHWETHLVYEEGLLYVEAETLRVLDADTGDFLKEFDLQTAPGRTIIFEGILYTADDWNDELLAVNGSTEEIVWRKRIPLARYRHTPDLIDGILYVTTEEGHLLAIDTNDGSLLWEYSDSPAVRVISNIVILDEVVYAVFADDTLRGIDALTGQEIGHLQAEGSERPSIGNYFGIAKVAIAGNLLLVTFDDVTLLALQPQ